MPSLPSALGKSIGLKSKKMIIKLILTCFCWIAVLPIIYGLNFGEKYIFLNIHIFLLLFWMFIFSKTTTKIIISLLFLFTFLILDNFPSKEIILKAETFSLFFLLFFQVYGF